MHEWYIHFEGIEIMIFVPSKLTNAIKLFQLNQITFRLISFSFGKGRTKMDSLFSRACEINEKIFEL